MSSSASRRVRFVSGKDSPRRRLVFVLFFLLALLVCRKWDNPYDPTGDRPPTAPVYVAPESGAVRQDTAPRLIWRPATDPDAGDTVRYIVYLGREDSLVIADSSRLDTFFPASGLLHLTRYSWQVRAHDGRGETTPGPVWTFTTIHRNTAPRRPYNPQPSSGSAGLGLQQTLSWRGGDPDSLDTVRYDLYFGNSRTLLPLRLGSRESSYVLPRLWPDSVYYWQVIARDQRGGVTFGDTWTFSTRTNNPPVTPYNPSPASGSTGLALTQTLRWSSGDPDPGDTVRYELYFGPVGQVTLVAGGLLGTSYTLPRLSYGTDYRWFVRASDQFGSRATSDTWTFATMSPITIMAPDSATRRRFGQWDTIIWYGGSVMSRRFGERRTVMEWRSDGQAEAVARLMRPLTGEERIGDKGQGKMTLGGRPIAGLAADSTVVYLSLNNGVAWTRLGVAPNPGFYYWQVPGPTTTSQARVQVRQFFPGDTAIGTSAPFTIYDSLRPNAIVVDTPTATSVWQVGSTQNIVWRGGVDGYDSIVIYYSADSGRTWTRQGRTYTAGRYPWAVSGPASNLAMVEVRSYCAAHPVVTGRSAVFRTTDAGYPDTVLVSINAGQSPVALALDSANNRLYVVNGIDSGTVTVISCSTNQVVASLRVGAMPVAAAWNRANGRIYVANQNSNSLSVIDCGTMTVVGTIPVGQQPTAVLWHPDRNKVYVANKGDSSVTIIAGNTGQVLRTVRVRANPVALCVRPDRGWVYVANNGSASVSVIDGQLDSVRQTIAVGSGPVAIVADDEHKAMYVANSTGNTVTVIDSLNVPSTTINVSLRPWALAFNPQNNKVYSVANVASKLDVINTDTRQVATTITVGNQPRAVVWATYTNKVYVANYAGNSVVVVDGITNAINRTLTVGSGPTALLWNGRARRVYSANYLAGTVTVIGRRTD